ncbi:MAG: polysaccharide pyruvyl transferase family protein [Oscillospiraceae bacterium]|nr:polysaccharide pyruvyl transferase family protein [Oscillospiraceae bacterium]
MDNRAARPRAAVVTFYHGENNYGALLQGYALSRALSRLGYEPELLRLQKSRASFSARLRGALKRHGPLRAFLLLVKRMREKARAPLNAWIRGGLEARHAALGRFRDEKIPHSETVYTKTTAASCADRYDVFLCGSDQIWNPALPDMFVYWLGFAPEGKRKIAYAPSLGGAKLEDEEAAAAQSYLRGLTAVSLRERDGRDRINELEGGTRAQWTLDPALLLTREDWDGLCGSEERPVEGPYLFAYLLGGSRRHRRAVTAYARRRGLRLVTLPHLLGTYRGCDARFGDERLYDVPPERFLSLIRHADAVATDSFHACVFAGLYHTPFWAFPRDGMNSRLHSLMEIFGAEGRLPGFDGGKAVLTDEAPPIDFDRLDRRVAERREESLAFLRGALTADIGPAACAPEALRKFEEPGERETGVSVADTGDACTGCRACELACPEQCLIMKPDAEGFIYPVIDQAACTRCGRCRRVCHARKTPSGAGGRASWFGWHRDETVRRGSSSGGAYTAIAECFSGGADDALIFGAVYDSERGKVRHTAAAFSGLAAQRKSKYVFSDLEDGYRRAGEALKQGRRVLFSGTPCQISGLYAYLGGDSGHLLTVDFICHGVPGPRVLREHLAYIAKGRELRSVDFRSKVYGWTRGALLAEFADGRRYLRDAESDAFMAAFLGDCSLRKSCYACRYSGEARRADVTLGDFWAVGRVDPAYNDEKGISLVSANTPKGRALIPALESRMCLMPLAPEDCAYAYAPHRYPLKRRKRYFAKLESGGYAAAARYAVSKARRRKLLYLLKQAVKTVTSRR